jgi:transketolase
MLTADPATVEEYAELRRHIDRADPPTQVWMLAGIASEVRQAIVRMIDRAGLGHIGGDLSVTDILVTLFGAVLNVDPGRPDWPERDRFILSKGHCVGALYATLARCGYFDRAELESFMAPLAMLNGHPDRKKVPGVETNTGPLGHGFPVAVGCALAARLRGTPWRTFVVLGDGELQEGSNWEAMMAASHYELDRLTVIVDRNRLQQGATVRETNDLEPLDQKATAFGFAVVEVNGHDHGELLDVLSAVPFRPGKPTFVIAHTHKGHPISFMSNNTAWHHKVPSADQLELALDELATVDRQDGAA